MCFDATDVDYSSVLDALMLGRSSNEVLQSEPPASADSQSAANSFPFASSSLDTVASPSPSILSGKEQQYSAYLSLKAIKLLKKDCSDVVLQYLSSGHDLASPTFSQLDALRKALDLIKSNASVWCFDELRQS